MRKVQSWLWIWVFWAFIVTGCSKAVGTFEDGPDQAPEKASAVSPEPSPAPSSSPVPLTGVVVTELAADSLPPDLLGQPTFSTVGYVFAREQYRNVSSQPVRLWPTSPVAGPLTMKSQVADQLGNMPVANNLMALNLSLSVTSNQNPVIIERVSDSILGSSIQLAPGESVFLNWRVSPDPNSGLCEYHAGTIQINVLGSPSSSMSQIVGDSLDLAVQRSVQVGDDPSHFESVFASESQAINVTTGVLAGSTSSMNCNGIFTDFVGEYWSDYYPNQNQGYI